MRTFRHQPATACQLWPLVLTILVNKLKVKVSWCKVTCVTFVKNVNILESADRITPSRILLQEAMVPRPFDNLVRSR